VRSTERARHHLHRSEVPGAVLRADCNLRNLFPAEHGFLNDATAAQVRADLKLVYRESASVHAAILRSDISGSRIRETWPRPLTSSVRWLPAWL
jgi:hypothetical protein